MSFHKVILLAILSQYSYGLFATQCKPNQSTSFGLYRYEAFRIVNDHKGTNSLYSYCMDMSYQSKIGNLDTCGAIDNPIDGLGLNPKDKLLYGLSPTDAMGIGIHLDLSELLLNPGNPGDMIKADNVKIYKIGRDGGYENLGVINPPNETVTIAPFHQVNPIVHSASTFNKVGDMFILSYRTNYSSQANIIAETASVTYQAPQIVIGQISNLDLANANGNVIPASWINVDHNSDPQCLAVMNQFKDQTNIFAKCVVDEFLKSGNKDSSIKNCLASNAILDKGIHDFAVSPVNGHFYAYDSLSYPNKDVLIEVNPTTKIASCTEIATPDAAKTGVLNSLYFSPLNKLVAIFANQTKGHLIDVNNGDLSTIPNNIASFSFGDAASFPFAANSKSSLSSPDGATIFDLIFKDNFSDIIFASAFDSTNSPVNASPAPVCAVIDPF